MVPQTETKAGAGFKAGVKDYRLTYYTPDYVVKDTDILAAFRMTPQPGVPPEECGAAVAAESSTGTWTTVWTDGLTTLDRYKGRCYDIEPVPGEDNQYIAYVAYPIDLFEEGSVTNLFTSIVGNVFGFKALRALRLEDLRISPAYVKTFQGPPHGKFMPLFLLNTNFFYFLRILSAWASFHYNINKTYKKIFNKYSTLLNGKSLKKSKIVSCVRNNQLNSGSPDPENDPEDEKNEISNSAMILQKGLQSLENPVLRGSFTLVLTTKDLHFFDEIAKQAFQEIINYGFYNVTCNSPDLNTIHLTTDQGKVQNKRPGVYVILNIQNRKCIVGQTC